MDVTGLVLTIGEPYASRALSALENQTRPCAAIVTVKNVTPFHRAMNEGIEKIETPFFLQCDADMVPDPDCIEVLMEHMSDDTAVTIGYLHDELWGKIQAIKLFRTESVRQVGFGDHVSPDTHLIDRMTDLGWRYRFARRMVPQYGRDPEVLGDHLPVYTPHYTFSKFRLEGARMARRGRFQELIENLDQLGRSSHSMAKFAMIGLCRGIFEDQGGDRLSRYDEDDDFRKLQRYMESPNNEPGVFDPLAVER